MIGGPSSKKPMSNSVKATSHSATFSACVCEIKDTDDIYPLKTALSTRRHSYDFEFRSFHAARAWKSLSEK